MSIVTASLLPEPPQRLYEEEQLQATVNYYLQRVLPVSALHFHIPNEGLRSKRAGERLKRMGLLPGVPDLAIVWGGRFIGIELKIRGGALSAAQKQVHARLRLCGAPVAVCRSVDEVEATLRECGVPLRGHVV